MKRNYENLQATDMYHTLYENLSDIFAFRQEKCARETLRISLPFVDGGGGYIITDEDSHEERATDGTVMLRFDVPRTAKLLWVKKI